MTRALVAVERALIAAGFLVLFFVLPHDLEGDDGARFDSITRLLDHGHLTGDRRSLLMPLVSTPVLELSHIVGSRDAWATHFNVLVVLAGALAAWLLLRGRVDATTLRRTLLILLFASLLTNRLRSYDSAILAGTLIALGIIAVVVHGRLSAGWAAISLGAAMTPAVLVALVPLAARDVWRTRRLRPFAWLAAGVLLVLAENWIRRGSPFDTGYGSDHGFRTLLAYSGRPGFSYPFLLGVASILFSFGRGLIFFTPGLTLWLDRRNRELDEPLRPLIVSCLLVVAGLVLVYAKWWAWYGGSTWGPRFFVFAALPASMLIAARIERVVTWPSDLYVLLVLALTCWVAYAGATADFTRTELCTRNHYALESMCWFEPTHSGLWWAVLHPPPLTWQRAVLAAWCAATFVTLALPLVRSRLAGMRMRRPATAWTTGWRL
jgi:hypothetical protein